MLKALIWVLGMPPEEEGKSGKRETAALCALFTLGLLIWSWGDMSETGRVTILTWMLTASSAMLAAAFGLDAVLKQGHLKRSDPPSQATATISEPVEEVADELEFDEEPTPEDLEAASKRGKASSTPERVGPPTPRELD